ncbi:DUF421 domain-containing protein [Desemzia sp. RIT804]|uniref:DUF421 domain-containing protein n=1 Tax=Desemzia sp. RIT 804 TaxID=2810209 RepID=UPI00194E23FD|nr:DUF421 domain-containing protein [Desemzia sp. RIT 804]MBM6613342.1 DUF421 domain-containing protein [Desemzia sp. RIT 804]
MFVSIGIKLIVGLMGLLLVMRILGKKTMSEITPFDLVYTLVLGGILEESLYDDAIHIGHILFALLIWGILIYCIEVFVQKNDKANQLVKGKPSVLVNDGKLNVQELEKNHMEMEQLRALLRNQDCFSLKEAKHVILETGGEVSVMKNTEVESVLTILLIDEGQVEINSLRSIGKDESWLREKLTKEGYDNPKKIIYGEWSKESGFYIVPYPEEPSLGIKIDG